MFFGVSRVYQDIVYKHHHKSFKVGLKYQFIKSMKAIEALVKPKGITIDL